MMLRLGGLVVFIIPMILSVLLKKFNALTVKVVCIFMEMVIVFILGIYEYQNILSFYSISFIASLQWSFFKGALGYESSVIFSTNNIKQTGLAIIEYIFENDEVIKQEKYIKFRFFGNTLFFFHLGVMMAYICYILSGNRSILWSELVLVSAVICLIKIYNERQNKIVKVY